MLGSRLSTLAFIGLLVAATARASDCSQTSVGFVPLTDLGAGTYHGEEGGLYSGGSNLRPPVHDAAGLARAAAIRPLDAAGAPHPSGRIVLLSIGMSNTTQEFSRFKSIADADPDRNSRLTLVDGAQGGQDAVIISNPGAAFWTNVDARLSAAGVTPAQVQAVWLKEAIAGPSPSEVFPIHPTRLRDLLEPIVQILHDRYPNLSIVYLASRTYAGYASTSLNPEPFAYESGFAVKWLIRDQISGDPGLNFDPGSGAVRAPWLCWGPYLWADGLTPRSDGLTWQCSDFGADGTHPSSSGQDKVAGLLLDFMKSDPTATPWFLEPGSALELPAEVEPNDDAATANPIAGGFTLAGSIGSALDADHFALAARAGEEIRIRVRTPGSSLNPRFTLREGSNILLADSDDDDGTDAFGCAVIGSDASLDLAVEGEAGTTGGYQLSMEKGARTGSESEPNNTPALADFIQDGDLLAATIDPPGDRDLIAFTAPAGTGFEISVRTCGGPAPAGRNLQMRILDGTGAVLLSDDDSGPDADPFLEGALPAAAAGYFIVIRSPDGGAGDPSFQYEVELSLANVTFVATPIRRGPVYHPGESIDLSVRARNRTSASQGGLVFRIDSVRPDGSSMRVLERTLSAPLPPGFEATRVVSLGPVPNVRRSMPLSLEITLAQDTGLLETRRVEVELRP